MALITNNISGSIANSSKIGVTGSVIISNDPIFPDFPGTDVVFFVSGSTDGTNKSSFGGDLIVSGAMSIGGDSLEVTGTIAATLGLSGSLTQLVDGTSYLIAGTNITITSASNGAITVAATGGSPGGATNEIQYNGGGVFTGSINFTFDGTNACLTGSFSQGNNSKALGGNSHAEGSTTQAIGNESHSEGSSTTSGFLGYLSNDISTSEQDKIYLDSSYGNVVASFSGGQTAIIHDSLYDNSIKYLTASVNGVSWNGTNTVLDFVGVTTIPFTTTAIIGVVGNLTPSGADQIMGQGSHAEGSGTLTIGYYSHAEGASTISSGQYSHAEGDATVASGEYSHAEGGSGGGGQLIASGDYSHAEGYNTTASGSASHAEGSGTIAIGDYSHVEGLGTIASGSYQHVGGKFNVRGNDFSLFVVGNGISDADVDRSDVFRINSGSVGDGRVEVTGSLAATMGLSGSLTTLVDGTSYLVAGNNITITSASNGSVTIDATSGASSYYLNFLAGTLSSTAASSSMESIGMDYYDIAKVPPSATSYVFKAILATTAGTTAYMDLYDYDGIVTGIPGPISGSVLTGSNQSYAYLTADLTPSLSAVTGSGIIEARIWCDPTGVSLNAICKNAKLEIA